MRSRPVFFVALAAAGILSAQTPPAVVQRLGAQIGAAGLRADVSFLASDAMEGRGTPSREQEIAAEFIAAQFRRAGLEPVGDDGYFQTAKYESVKLVTEGLTFSLGDVKAAEGTMTIQETVAAELAGVPGFKVSLGDAAAVEALTAEQVRGKVMFVEFPEANTGGAAVSQSLRRILTDIGKLEPAMLVLVRSTGQGAGGNSRASLRAASSQAGKVPILAVWDAAIREAVAAAKPGPMEAAVTAHIAPPVVTPVKLRNVAGVLRGTDPQLKDTYVVLTAHYDHLGVRANAEGDRVYNGANDNASGTASVIAVANALGSLEERPRRTIVFVTLFGEELGGLGGRWYTSHPIFPLVKTVADVNLEQLGRTDDTEGPRVLQFNLTGFDFTDIASVFGRAGALTGVGVVKHEKNSDSFFARSDNATFAEAGIPSTTLSVSYIFPDYHQPGDEWQKLDYDNLAKVDLTVALGVLEMANSETAPQWNKENPKTARYVAARERQ